MFDVESVLEEAPESTEQLDFDRIQDIEMMGGTTSGYVWVHLANLKQILAAQCIQIRNEQMRDMRKRITFLEKQNEGYIRQVVQSQANMRQVVEALELKQWEVDKIPALESELKLKNEQKRNLLEEKRVCEEKIKLMDAELKRSKVDSDCPICLSPYVSSLLPSNESGQLFFRVGIVRVRNVPIKYPTYHERDENVQTAAKVSITSLFLKAFTMDKPLFYHFTTHKFNLI